MEQKLSTATLREVRLVFRNFTGKEGKFNAEGDRSFGVVIPDMKTAEAMLADGWNVKTLKPNPDYVDEGDDTEGTPYLPVAVEYRKGRPPKIYLVVKGKKRRTLMKEDEVHMLDGAEIDNVDMIVNPSRWNNPRGDSGVKAYLKTMFVTIVEDELEAEYSEDDEDDEG